MTKQSTLYKTAGGLGIISIIARVFGFVREQIIAWRFGASEAVDAYVVALGAAGLVAGILMAAIGAAFLPVYSRERAAGRGKQLVSGVFYALLGLSVFGALITYFYAPLIVQLFAGSFSATQQSLTILLLQILSVTGVLGALVNFVSLLLNAHNDFYVPALYPIIMNTILIGGLLLIGGVTIEILAILTVLSALIPAILLMLWSDRGRLGLRAKPSFGGNAMERILALSAPIFAGSFFGQLYLIVDRRLASGLDAGSIASLSFANRLVQLPVGIFITGLVAVVYPTLADLAAKNLKKESAHVFASALRVIIIVIVPATVGLYVLRYPVVQLAFERGSFDAAATTKTAVAMGYFALGLLAISAGQLVARMFHSLEDTLTPLKIGIAMTIVAIPMAMVLVRLMGHGGLALTASLTATLSVAIQFFMIKKRLGVGSLGVAKVLLKVSLASIVMGLVSHFTWQFMANWHQIFSLAAAVGTGLAVYGLLLLFSRIEEVDRLVKKFIK